jgi:hypothetical protein
MTNKEPTMKIRFALLIVSAATLAACSGGPSTSDAKAVILNKIGNGQGCSRLDIQDFEKVNGIAQDDKTYQVAVKYTLVIKPPHGDELTEDQYEAQWDPNAYKPDLVTLPSQQMWRDCPTVSSDLVQTIYGQVQSYDFNHSGHEAYLEGFSIELTETLQMIKTDNGWQQSL